MVIKNGACPTVSNSTSCPVPVTPIISVKSVNGEIGDVVLSDLVFGEKTYNGSERIELVAKDIGLEKAIKYKKATETERQTLFELSNAELGDLYCCKENSTFYFSVGEGDYKTFPTSEKLKEFSKVVDTASKVAAHVSDDFVLTLDLLDKDGNVFFTSDPVQIPFDFDELIKSGYYDSVAREIVFILNNGKEIRVPVEGIIHGLQKEITEEEPLPFSLVGGLGEFKADIYTKLYAEIENRAQAISNEIVARKGADELEATTRESADSLEKEARIEADTQEKQDRISADDLIRTDLQNETSERIEVNRILETKIRLEEKKRFDDDEELRNSVQTEITDRIASESQINDNISTLQEDLRVEKETRTSEVSELNSRLDTEIQNRESSISTLTNDLSAEIISRKATDESIYSAIHDEISDRTVAVEAEKQERIAGDQGLADLLATETADRITGNEAVQEKLDIEVATRKEKDNELLDSIAIERSRRISSDDDIKQLLANETADRKAADEALQEEIDNIPVYGVTKDSTTGTNFAVYHLTKQIAGGEIVYVGSPIEIPRDFLVKNAELKTVTTKDIPYPGAQTGDKYIDFTINTQKDPSTGTESHIYLPVKDLVDVYNAGNGIVIDTNNVISINNETLQKIDDNRILIVKEIQDRKDADLVLQQNINTVINDLSNHTSNTSNPHNVTKAQVGLGNVDNTSDLNKPISNATQTALDNEVLNRDRAISVVKTELENKIDTEIAELQANLTAEETARINADTTEEEARKLADSTLRGSINNNRALINTEETARINADTILQQQIDDINTRKNHYSTIINCDGTQKDFIVQHDLNTLDLIIQVYDTYDNATVITDTYRKDANSIQVSFKDVPEAGKKYRVLMYGIRDVIVSFNANGGTGNMSSVNAIKGVPYKMPINKLTAPDGKEFDKWAIGSASGTQVKEGDYYTFNLDTEVYALWKDEVQVPNIYYGSFLNKPTGDPSQLVQLSGEKVNRNDLLTNGYRKVITIGQDEFRHESFAIARSLNLNIEKIEILFSDGWYDVTEEYSEIITTDNEFIIRYHENAVNDCSTNYRITFN